MASKRPSLTSLTPLLEGLDAPASCRGRTFAGAQEQFWPDALPAATGDSYGCQQQLNPGSLGTSPLP